MSCTHLTFFEKAGLHSKAQRILAMLDEMEPNFRRAFLQMEAGISSELTVERLLGYIERGDTEAALRIVQRHATRLANLIPNFQAQSGASTAQAMEQKLDFTLDFDRMNIRALNVANNSRYRLIREITQGQRDSIRGAITDGIRNGWNPRQTAVAVRNSIGLTETQQGHVSRYRTALEQGSKSALGRRLRDRRFDRTVNAAARNGRELPTDVIDRMVERYRQNYVRHRAETIARTESLRAVHEGQAEMIQQAIDEGAVQPGQMKMTWISARDQRTRDTHLSLDGTVAEIGAPFTTSEGTTIRFPGDPEAPAGEVINCRCVVAFQFK